MIVQEGTLNLTALIVPDIIVQIIQPRIALLNGVPNLNTTGTTNGERVLSYGYPHVAWYPEGIEGWERANLPVAVAQAEPRAGEESAHKDK